MARIDIIWSSHEPVRMVQIDIINKRHGPAGMARIDIICSLHGPVRMARIDIIWSRHGPVHMVLKDIIENRHGPVRMVLKDIINNRHGPVRMVQKDIINDKHGPVRIARIDIINTRHGPTGVTQINIIQSRDWPVRMARTYCYSLSLDSLLLMLPGQLVPIRYNLHFGRPASTAYNTIPAGDRWPVWLGKLSSWVSGTVREIPLNGLPMPTPHLLIQRLSPSIICAHGSNITEGSKNHWGRCPPS